MKCTYVIELKRTKESANHCAIFLTLLHFSPLTDVGSIHFHRLLASSISSPLSGQKPERYKLTRVAFQNNAEERYWATKIFPRQVIDRNTELWSSWWFMKLTSLNFISKRCQLYQSAIIRDLIIWEFLRPMFFVFWCRLPFQLLRTSQSSYLLRGKAWGTRNLLFHFDNQAGQIDEVTASWLHPNKAVNNFFGRSPY